MSECKFTPLHKPSIPNSHSHGHSHDHGASTTTNKKMLFWGICITFVGMIFEFVFAIITNSLALLSDTLHMFSHIFALGLSYFAMWLSSQKGKTERTFGFYRAEVLAAFVNSISVAIFGIFIIYEGIAKLINPENIEILPMITVAVIGLIVNIVTGILLLKADMDNINIKSAFLHMMSDLLSSVAIVIGGVIVYFTNAVWIDAILALLIAVIILRWSFSLMRQSADILLETSPFSVEKIRTLLLENSFVIDAHDIHISEITHNMYVLTAHLIIEKNDILEFENIVVNLNEALLDEFNIAHATFQPEFK